MKSLTSTLFPIMFVLLPILSISITGRIYPVKAFSHRPIFQPPNWVFGIIWTYITLSLGIVSYSYYRNFSQSVNKFSLLFMYLLIIFMLNLWLIINHYKKYGYGFSILVTTCYISVIYLLFLSINSSKSHSSKIVYLLPLVFWLVLASCLNGVIYDYADNQ